MTGAFTPDDFAHLSARVLDAWQSGVDRDYFYFPGDGFGFGLGLAVRTDPGNAKHNPVLLVYGYLHSTRIVL